LLLPIWLVWRRGFDSQNICVPAQEHAGLDPATQIVPSGGSSAGWKKAEEESSANELNLLAAGSTWASGPARPAAAPWQAPPEPGTVPAPLPPVPRADRRLNPVDFPTLGAAAKAAVIQQPLPIRSALVTAPTGQVGELCL
jgi:hypothetical protein